MAGEAHLYIDGYNVVHAWPEARRHWPGAQEAARAVVIEAAQAVHDWEQIAVTVVFDGKGSELSVETPNPRIPTFNVVFAPTGLTADTVIEQLARKRADDGVAVATGDRLLAETVRALGGAAWSPEALADRVRMSRDRAAAALRARARRIREETPWGQLPL